MGFFDNDNSMTVFNGNIQRLDFRLSCYSPPVADEDLLAEDGAVGAEEGDGVEGVRSHGVPETHVIRLKSRRLIRSSQLASAQN